MHLHRLCRPGCLLNHNRRYLHYLLCPPVTHLASRPTVLRHAPVRVYYTVQIRPPSRLNGAPSHPTIHSAISADGVHYTFEPGQRFGVDGEMVVDCAVARLGKTWHLYSPVQGGNGQGYHAVSDDGLTFKRLDNVTI